MVRRASQWRARELRGREIDAAADRGTVGEGARCLDDHVAQFARRRRAVDRGPVDHDLLRPESRPFDEADRDLSMRPGLDGIEHLRIGDRRRIAVALQQELGMIDAARDVGCEHEQKIDRLGRKRRWNRGQDPWKGRQQRRQYTSNEPHGRVPDVVAAPRSHGES